MDPTYKQEVTVGALVLFGFVVFTGFMFWLTRRSIVSKAVPVQVVFKNISGLKEGDPVRVSGVTKGRVGELNHHVAAGAGDVAVGEPEQERHEQHAANNDERADGDLLPNG